ncbi:coagulation factor VII isoform X1 [Phyllobates terribilis]|uniref:coagulation factor VII isoform X1 n=1 Tax=Phyllobates terribilis TaxID=111132 RepID=UPI003CCB0508
MGLGGKKMTCLWIIVILLPLLACAVFIQTKDANTVLKSRIRRANSIFEEFRQASLERECYEEKCSYEEAREFYKDDRRTKEFWRLYIDENQCLSNPCQNGGTCYDEYQFYMCLCPEGYEGRNCEINKNGTLRCEFENGQCEQLCHDTPTIRRCSCMEGYALGEDGTSCIPTVEYPCGQIPVLKKKILKGRIVGGEECPKGECPWQARVVLDRPLMTICGGTLIAPSWVVTAAHCVKPSFKNKLTVVLGDHRISKAEGTEKEHKVVEIIIHEKFVGIQTNNDNDIALLRLNSTVNYTDYVVPLCLPDVQFTKNHLLHQSSFSVVSGWGRLLEGGVTPDVLRRVILPRVMTQECIEKTQMNITANMFCAGFTDGSKDSCKGDSGGPYATKYKETYYLTGIVSWGLGCAKVNTYGVYTRVSRYADWLTEKMKPDSS